MAKKLFILLLLISIFTYTGCGGGSKKKKPPLLSTIQGTVTFDMSGSTSYYRSDSMTALSKSAYFPKAAVQKTHFSPPAVSNEKIVKFRPETSYSQVNDIVAKMGGRIKKKLYGTVSTYLLTIEEQTFSKSAANLPSGVEYIEDNLIYHALEVPDDPYYKPPYNWNHKMLNLEKAWDVQRGVSIEPGKEIIVAVLDTGIAPNHEDLKGNLVPGHDCVDGDSDPSDMQNGHGTHVAGIIGAIADNTFGTAGVGWNAVKIMPIRVLDSKGEGTLEYITAGINWARENGAKVINLSLGGTEEISNTLKKAIDDALSADITVIAAAGNEGGAVASPANYGPVIAVASLDHTCSRSSYSNFGPKIDFCAPGGGVPRTQHETEWAVKTVFNTYYSGYAYMAGTSQAAPHISGLAALLYAQDSDIKPEDVEQHLIDGCIDLGDIGKDNIYGHGLPDAYEVLEGNINSTPKMANIKIFIGTPKGALISNLQHVGASGDFTLSDLEAGTYNIYAFDDSGIKNNKIDSGEKYGYTQVYLPKDTLVTEVNIALNLIW